MMRTFDNIIYKRHHLVMDETKVMEALRIIQKTCNRLFTQIQIDMAVGSCGWKNSTMWYINLTCSNTEWRNLIKELLIEPTRALSFFHAKYAFSVTKGR